MASSRLGRAMIVALLLGLALGQGCSSERSYSEEFVERQAEIAHGWYEFFVECGAGRAVLAMVEEDMGPSEAEQVAVERCREEYWEQQEPLSEDYVEP